MKTIWYRNEGRPLGKVEEVRIICETCGEVDKAWLFDAPRRCVEHNNRYHAGTYNIREKS